MKNPKPLNIKIETDDILKLAHLDVLDDLLKESSEKFTLSESNEVEDLAEVIADVYRELFVKNFMKRYEKEVTNYSSLIHQIQR